MKILKKGVVPHEKKMFICKYCGCVFIAEKGEYRKEYSQKEDRYWYTTTCACCGGRVLLRMEPSY